MNKNIYNKDLSKALKNSKVREFLKNIGPDQNLVNYTFNYFTEKEGGKKEANGSLKWTNTLNQMVFDDLHVAPWEEYHAFKNATSGKKEESVERELMISKTTFSKEAYGQTFLDGLAQRLGIVDACKELVYLRSTVMDPWTIEMSMDPTTPSNLYQEVLMPALLKTVDRCVQKVREIETGTQSWQKVVLGNVLEELVNISRTAADE